MAISDQIRKAINDSEKPLYLLAAEVGVSPSMLWRFANGKDIRLETADRLADHLGLELVPRGKRLVKRAKKSAKKAKKQVKKVKVKKAKKPRSK